MSQLVCPLCGRFVSLRNFDPSGFDSDIYAVNVVGLGRGRGFAVSETFSILGDPAVIGPIAERCRRILSFIERGRVLYGDELKTTFAEVERLKGEVLMERRAREDLLAKLAEIEGQAQLWRAQASRFQRAWEEGAAKIAGLEEELWRSRTIAAGLKAEVDGHKTNRDNRVLENLDDEEEMLASEEMEEILNRINASANTNFEYLSDAVDFLLEGG